MELFPNLHGMVSCCLTVANCGWSVHLQAASPFAIEAFALGDSRHHHRHSLARLSWPLSSSNTCSSCARYSFYFLVCAISTFLN